MVFADLDLSRRLERTEGQACLEFAEARRLLNPDSGANWIECSGAYAALLDARMRYAFEHGYELAMMVAEVGSQSQRNAERQGFRIAYTRTKWRL
jgi:hypothetical protein